MSLNKSFMRYLTKKILHTWLLYLCVCFFHCNFEDLEGPTDEIFNESVVTDKLKIEYSYRVGYNPVPLGISPLEILYQRFWVLDNIDFEEKNPADPVFQDALDYNNMTRFLDYFNNYLNMNSGSPYDEKIIYAFGVPNVISNFPGSALGFNLAFHRWKTSTSGDPLDGYPTLAFTVSGKIDDLISDVDLRKKIKTISTTHEILHGRGLSDLNGECGDWVHGHHDALGCCMENVWLSSLNYPLDICPYHVHIIEEQLADFIRTGVNIGCP